MKYLIKFSYDGSVFNGYQKQLNRNTIQDNIEYALYKRFNKEVNIYASGRTDAGVHAINQYAHFEVDEELDTEKIKVFLNDNTNEAIYIKDISKVDNHFNARFSAKKKTYKYIINTEQYDIFKRNYELYYDKSINYEKISEISKIFIGEHDFENFTTVQDKKETYIRVIEDIKVEYINGYVVIYITGLGFLRYMVRNIVGSILQYNEGKLTKEDIEKMLNKETDIKPVKVKPCGLYLFDVEY